MNRSDVLFLLDYTGWANGKLLQAAQALSPEQFAAPHRTTYGSLRGILVHMLVAYQVWRSRLQTGRMPVSLPEHAGFPDVAALAARLEAEQVALRAWVAALSEAELQGVLEYRTSRGEVFRHAVWQILLHLANHTTQHRSEAAEVLTEYGCSPGDLDLIWYLRQ